VHRFHRAARVDDLCFIHPLASKASTHGPGEMCMSTVSTGFTLTYYQNGTRRRLTNAHGHKIRDLLT